jgi:hypothetical protein
MRRIVMFNWLTTDGYFSGPDGNLLRAPQRADFITTAQQYPSTP